MSSSSSSYSQNQGENVASSANPSVLTRNIIPSLTRGLDASDVLECYALVRNAPLHGIANSTIEIQKMSLGVRYRPSGVSRQQDHHPGMELTLEYGPQRVGPLLKQEAMPILQLADVSSASSSVVAWVNVGNVYYTTEIAMGEYVSSYYMASMTGAVLNKILIHAVEYAEKRRHYQPFSVFSSQSKKELRSSSSADFTDFMWHSLAYLGVEIEPILPPPVYEARLWVDSIEKVGPEPSITQAAAVFYQKLYMCLEAIATNDYKAFVPSVSPTLSPAPTHAPSQSPPVPEDSVIPDEDNNNNNHIRTGTPDHPSSNGNNSNETVEGPTSSTTDTSAPEGELVAPPAGDDTDHKGESDSSSNDDTETIEPGSKESSDSGGLGRSRLEGVDEEGVEETEETDDFIVTESNNEEVSLDGDDSTVTDGPTAAAASPAPTRIGDSTSSNNVVPTSGQGEDVEKAQQAAQEAQIAADEAKNAAQTEGETKAADAAQAAANAAKAAADATSNAASQAAMDGLLNGDGSTMTSIVTTCFVNPQYDIASIDENGTVTTEAYLYKDGSQYYKLNLISPYFEIARLNRPLPKATTLSNGGSGGDFIDWLLALLVLGSIVLGVLVIVQQMGYQCIDSLFKCQKWFFNPRKYDYEGNSFLQDEDGSPYPYGEDAIPLSMGGRRTNASPMRNQVMRHQAHMELHNPDLHVPNLDHDTPTPFTRNGSSPSAGGDVEMSRILSGSRLRRTLSQESSNGSRSDESAGMESVSGVPDRLTRDPDLVDLPDLKSRSKVAVPVGSSRGRLKRGETPFGSESSSLSNGSADPFA